MQTSRRFKNDQIPTLLTQSTTSHRAIMKSNNFSSLFSYSLLVVFISQFICPVLLPICLASLGRVLSVKSVEEISVMIGFGNDESMIRYKISTNQLIDIMQWIVHVPLVVLPFCSMLYGKAGDRNGRLFTYWFCIILLFFSNVLVSVKQALFDCSMFIPNLLNSLEIHTKDWSNLTPSSIGFNQLFASQFRSSSMLPHVACSLLLIAFVYHFVRDVIIGLPIENLEKSVIGFIRGELRAVLLDPFQRMLNISSTEILPEPSNPSLIEKKTPPVTPLNTQNGIYPSIVNSSLLNGSSNGAARNVTEESSNKNTPTTIITNLNGEPKLHSILHKEPTVTPSSSTTPQSTTSPLSPSEPGIKTIPGKFEQKGRLVTPPATEPGLKTFGNKFMQGRGLNEKLKNRASFEYGSEILSVVHSNINSGKIHAPSSSLDETTTVPRKSVSFSPTDSM